MGRNHSEELRDLAADDNIREEQSAALVRIAEELEISGSETNQISGSETNQISGSEAEKISGSEAEKISGSEAEKELEVLEEFQKYIKKNNPNINITIDDILGFINRKT